MRTRLVAMFAVLTVLLGLPFAASAQAAVADPDATVAPGGKWFSGGLVSMWGLNCTILGGSYNEMMIQGYAGYGGASGGGAPKVNDTFYAVINLSEPGNPCGPGVSVPELRLSLPAGVSIDGTKPIRCFVTPRFVSNSWDETTNAGDWSIPSSSGPITGPWCRQTPYNLGNNTFSIGTPAMANGTMHKVYVPIKATSAVTNADLSWEIRDPVTYEGSVTSSAALYVFSSNSGSPSFFFPDEAVIPFWDRSAPAGAENRAEFFVNLYTAGQAGYLCFEVQRASDSGLVWSCTWDANYNGTVASGLGVVQLLPQGANKGPNGGYVPFSFDPPEYDKNYTVQWFFKTSLNGSVVAQSPKLPFRSLAGSDGDGDGVVDAVDQCDATAGTVANGGCPPAVPTDSDGDGVIGLLDKCPDRSGGGSADGCPAVSGGGGTDGTGTGTGGTGGGDPVVTTAKTVKIPAKLRGAKGLKSTTPKVCKVSGKGKKAKVTQVKAGKCTLVGVKQGRKIKVILRLR